jgi:hypothetical protein
MPVIRALGDATALNKWFRPYPTCSPYQKFGSSAGRPIPPSQSAGLVNETHPTPGARKLISSPDEDGDSCAVKDDACERDTFQVIYANVR